MDGGMWDSASEYQEEIISEETREENWYAQGQVFFKNDHYSIYYNHLEDEMYENDAYVIFS